MNSSEGGAMNNDGIYLNTAVYASSSESTRPWHFLPLFFRHVSREQHGKTKLQQEALLLLKLPQQPESWCELESQMVSPQGIALNTT